MDSRPQESVEADKPEFPKPFADSAAATRKYRRRSPATTSPSPSPPRHSPIRESTKITDDPRIKDDRRDLHRDSGRSRYGRTDRHSDRHSSRSSRSHHRHDDHNRRDKYADDIERDNSKLLYSRVARDSSSDRAVSGRRHHISNTEDVKSKDRDRRKDDRATRDYKTDRRKGYGDSRNSRSPAHEESRDYPNDSFKRDSSGRRLSESSGRDTKEYNLEKSTKEGKRKDDDQDRYKERSSAESRGKFEERKSPRGKGRESPSKRPKGFSMDTSSGHGQNDEKHSSNSKEALECGGKMTSEQVYVTDADIDAAKVAAMKAAELVNRNLVGTGYMSTEQKKKLLWGNKKNTAAEESAHRWETPLFDDRERQEKFNKLMGVKGEIKVEQKQEVDEAEKEKIQMDLEKQYTAGLRRRDGRTVGLGL